MDRVAACQIRLTDLAVEENLARVRECVDALPEDVALAVFPEYTLTGFAPDERIRTVALARDGETLGALRSLADREDLTVETPVGTAGLLTCYDLNFVGDSAQLARSEVTTLVVVGANRTGTRDLPDAEPVTYGGRSLVARPDGGIHRALDRQERTLVADLDPEVLATQRDLVGVFSG